MNVYQGATEEELRRFQQKANEKYEKYQAENLNLNMARGKPCPEQLDLSNGLYNDIKTLIDENGTDCRNYGGVAGLPETRKLFADLLNVKVEELIIGGNSSLNIIYDNIARAFNYGVDEESTPWSKLEKVKFLCPSPGYDRHFAICELFGIEMITIPMQDNGPDIDRVEELVKEDESIKGIWCVPKYSNPTGVVYSDEIVNRLAAMETKANDFRIFWDNAYIVHHLTDNPPRLKNILHACQEYKNPDRVYIYVSTSKITFAGAGLSIFASSKKNIDYIVGLISKQTIGPNKINQLLHTRFFKTVAGILEHMKKHATIIKPKFDLVQKIMERELADKNIACWSNPKGGYFINLDVMEGCAGKVVQLAKDAGVTLTKAGATYPYGKDPADTNIRIAPTFPPTKELEKAINIVAVCIEKATLDKLLK